MKKILFVILTIALLSLCLIITNVNKNTYKYKETTLNIDKKIKLLSLENVNIIKTNIKGNLNYYGNYEIELESFNGNYIYGSYQNSNQSLQTIGLWQYNIENKEFKFYKYNNNDRVWSFIIKDDIIYFITLTQEYNLYKWKLLKSNLNFNNIEELDNGILKQPLNTPFFIEDEITHKIILFATYDDIEFQENTKLSKHLSKYKISILNDNNFTTLIEENGDHINKKGIFSYSPYTNINFYNSKIIYCNVSYYDKESIILYDIEKQEKKTLYENKDLDNWYLSMTKCNDKNCILSFNDRNAERINNKIVNINLKNKNINIIKSNDNKTIGNIRDNDFIVYSSEAYLKLSGDNNSFTARLDLNNGFYSKFLTNYSNKFILEGKDNEIYIIELK